MNGSIFRGLPDQARFMGELLARAYWFEPVSDEVTWWEFNLHRTDGGYLLMATSYGRCAGRRDMSWTAGFRSAGEVRQFLEARRREWGGTADELLGALRRGNLAARADFNPHPACEPVRRGRADGSGHSGLSTPKH